MKEILERLQKVMEELTVKDIDLIVEVGALHEGSMKQIVDYLEYVNNYKYEAQGKI